MAAFYKPRSLTLIALCLVALAVVTFGGGGRARSDAPGDAGGSGGSREGLVGGSDVTNAVDGGGGGGRGGGRGGGGGDLRGMVWNGAIAFSCCFLTMSLIVMPNGPFVCHIYTTDVTHRVL